MRPGVAAKIALARDTAGGAAYPGITVADGGLAGIPVLTSTAVPSSASGDSIIVLVDAAEILLADDAGVSFDVSEQASIQMNSAPSSSAAQQVSLWQNNLLGIRVERMINWAPRRSAAAVAAYIDQVAY